MGGEKGDPADHPAGPSSCSRQGVPPAVAYQSSRATIRVRTGSFIAPRRRASRAITSFTRSLAAQLADRGIRVNGVAPGPIWTPLIPASFSEEEVAKFGGDTPLGRPGQPEEVAPAYVYLVARDSSYVTGQIIHVNGGQPVAG